MGKTTSQIVGTPPDNTNSGSNTRVSIAMVRNAG